MLFRSFDFSVTDGQSNTLAGQSFAITVNAVDDTAPAQVNTALNTPSPSSTVKAILAEARAKVSALVAEGLLVVSASGHEAESSDSDG